MDVVHYAVPGVLGAFAIHGESQFETFGPEGPVHKGVILQLLPRTISADKKQLERILAATDILVDATTGDTPYRRLLTRKLLVNVVEK